MLLAPVLVLCLAQAQPQPQPATAPKGGQPPKAQTNPIFQSNTAQGVNPMHEQTRRQVTGLLAGMAPGPKAKLEAAARELSTSPLFRNESSGPRVWAQAEDLARRTFGAQRPPDPLEALTAVLLGRAAELAGVCKGREAAYATVSNVLKTKHDTAKNSISNMR